jgi:hypothetical protein
MFRPGSGVRHPLQESALMLFLPRYQAHATPIAATVRNWTRPTVRPKLLATMARRLRQPR